MTLRKAGIYLKAKKCEFAMSEVKYLGHIVGVDGIRPDPVKTKVIDDFKPESRSQITRFHGMCSFTENLSKISQTR